MIGIEDRLDFSYWHPKFEQLIKMLETEKFETKELTAVLCSPIISGKTPENYVYPMKGVPFLGARNIKNGKIDFSDIVYIDDYIHEGMLQSSKITTGDILVTMAGAIGRCAIYSSSEEANISQAVARLKPNLDLINPNYLLYYLNSSIGQLQFERNRHVVNQPNINTTEMGKIKVIRPDKSIQNNIINQLSDIEKTIEIEKRLQEDAFQKLRNIILLELGLSTPSVKFDWYVQPSINIGERLDFVWNHPTTSSVKQYLEDKNAVALGELIKDEVDYGLNASGKDKGKVPFVNIEQVQPDGTIHHEEIKHVDGAPLNKLLKPNDILICRSRAVGTAALVTEAENDFTFGSFILRIRLKETTDISPQYMVSFLNSDLGKIQFKFLQTGSEKFAFTEKTGRGGGNNINTTNLKKLMVILPEPKERQTIIREKIQQLLKSKQDNDIKLKSQIDFQNGLFERMLFGWVK